MVNVLGCNPRNVGSIPTEEICNPVGASSILAGEITSK